MNPRWIALLTLLGGAAWLALFGDKTPAGVIVAAPATTVADSHAPRSSTRPTSESALLVLVPREQLFAQTGDRTGSNPFASRDWSPAPAPARAHVVAPPAPAPVAPDLPFVYVGKKLQDGEWEAYLVREDKTLIVRQGTVIDDYRIERIEPPALVLNYLPLQQSQTLNIGSPE